MLWITVEDFLNLVHLDGRSMEEEMNRRNAGFSYDLRCKDYKIFRHQAKGNYYDFLKEAFNMDVPVDEQNLPGELADVVWNGEAVSEHDCTIKCLLSSHNRSDNSSASDVMHVVDVVEDNR